MSSGNAVDISSDGTTIAVSSPSAAGSSRAGTVQVFRLGAGAWTQVGDTLQGEQIPDTFGDGLSLSANGSRIAVSAPNDREGGTSGGGSPGGKVRVFDSVGAIWTQVGNDVLGNTGLNGENLGETLRALGRRHALCGHRSQPERRQGLHTGERRLGADRREHHQQHGRGTIEGVALSADGRTVAVGFVNGTPRRARVFSIAP